MYQYLHLPKFLLLIAVSGSTAKGDVIYELFFRAPTLGDGLDTTELVAAGQVFSNTQVILRETVVPGGSDSTSYLAESNINFHAANLFSSGGDGRFTRLTLDTEGGVADSARNDDDTLAYLVPLSSGLPGKPSTVTAEGREVLLGTVDLIAPTSGSTQFRVADFSTLDGDFTTFTSPAGLESLAFNSGPSGGFVGLSLTLSITAVPEPSSLWLAGILAGLGVFRRRV